MSLVKSNALRVPAGRRPELEVRLTALTRMADLEPGFEGLQLLRPVHGEDRYFVVTTWMWLEDFVAWRAKVTRAPAHPTRGVSSGAASASPTRPAPHQPKVANQPSASPKPEPRRTHPADDRRWLIPATGAVFALAAAAATWALVRPPRLRICKGDDCMQYYTTPYIQKG
jgi:heme-degrading monooxygenase HmoA